MNLQSVGIFQKYTFTDLKTYFHYGLIQNKFSSIYKNAIEFVLAIKYLF